MSIHHDLNITFYREPVSIPELSGAQVTEDIVLPAAEEDSSVTLLLLIQTIHLEQNHHLLLLHLIHLTLFLLQAILVFLIQMSLVRTQILIYKYTINPQYHHLSLLVITSTKVSDLVMKRLTPIHLLFTTFTPLPSKIVVTLQN